MQNNTIRNIWFDFKSEVIFGSVLILLTVLSYWLAAYIPEQVFEDYINPIEYIGTSAVCFFGALLLLTHSEHNRLRMSWAAVLLVWGCVDVVMWAMRYILHIKMIGGTPSDPLFNASVTLGNTLAFMLFIYPTQVLRPGWLNWRRSVLLLLPMLLLGVVDYIVPANLLLLIMVYPVIIFLTLCRHLHKYRQWCEDNFSTLDDIDAQWIVRYLTMLALAGLAFYFIVFWYVPNRMFTQQWLFLLMFTYTTERVLYRPDPWQRLKENPISHSDSDLTSHSDSDLTSHSDSDSTGTKSAVLKLEAWLEQEKPYCNPDFQLTDLHKVLPMNRTYLSQLINAEYGCSFYQWVNGLRINEAKRLMTEQPEIRMHEVAKLSGFSSPVVFSRVFIRETGIAPSKWGQKSNNS
jgi:AraC-like DNA-binding protein